MNNVIIHPNELKGEVEVPSSKSITHRAIIAAALCKGRTIINNVTYSKDIEATCNAMESLGAKIGKKENSIVVESTGKLQIVNNEIDCEESGSTLRFIIPIIASLNKKVTLKGKGNLVKRPLKPYYEIFDKQNVEYENDKGQLPLVIKGNLRSGDFHIRGDVSSQFITGLLFILPILKGDSKIILTSNLQSKPYVDLTLEILKKFSIHIVNYDYKIFFIKGNQEYKSIDLEIEKDFSQAAFWIAAGVLGKEVCCINMNEESYQGDKEIINLLQKMKGNVAFNNRNVISKKSEIRSIDINVSEFPDLAPMLAVLLSLSEGKGRIFNAGRLRIKESDRLRAIAEGINKLGGKVTEKPNELIIEGVKNLKGGTVDSFNDHRIAMALAIASIKCTEDVIIKHSNSVEKSYPNFFNDFNKLGGKSSEWNL